MLKEYRILWEKTQLGNTIVKAENEKEAIKIAYDTKKTITWEQTKITVVNAYTFK